MVSGFFGSLASMPGNQGSSSEQERYAANVAKRLAGPPVIAAPDPVVVSSPEQDRYAANVARRLALIQQPAAPPTELPVENRDFQRSLEVIGGLAAPGDQIALEPSAVPNQPIESLRLFPEDEARYKANVARRLQQEYGIPGMEPPAPPQYHPGRGWLAKLGQHLLGAAEGVGAGLATGHPLGGAIMGFAGGVHPQLGANAWYNNVTLPRWEGAQEQALDLAGKRLGLLSKAADMTGVNLVTGEATAGQAKEDALEAYRNMAGDLKRSREELDRLVKTGQMDRAQAELALKERLFEFEKKIKELEVGIQQQRANTYQAGQQDAAQFHQGELKNQEDRNARLAHGRRGSHGQQGGRQPRQWKIGDEVVRGGKRYRISSIEGGQARLDPVVE
jgi:hypothetical protein